MKNNPYLKQFFSEGLGNIFYIKGYNILNNKVKNNYLKKFLIVVITVIYSVISLFIAWLLFILTFPF